MTTYRTPLKYRIQYAWHVFRGRPLAYRMRFNPSGAYGNGLHVIVAECYFDGETNSWPKN